MLRSILLAAGALGLVISGCVDSGGAVIWPKADFDVGFLVTIDALGVPDGIIEGPFALADGSADGLDIGVVSIPEGGELLLIEVGPEKLDRAVFPEGVELRVDQIRKECAAGVLNSGRIDLSLAQAGARVHVLEAGQFIETSVAEAPATGELVLSFVSAASRGCEDVQLNPRPFGPGSYEPAQAVAFGAMQAVSADRIVVGGQGDVRGTGTAALFWVRRDGPADVVTSPDLEDFLITSVLFAPPDRVVASAWAPVRGGGAIVRARIDNDELSIIDVVRFDHGLLDVSFDESIPLMVVAGKRGLVVTSTHPMGPYFSHQLESADFDYLYSLVADMDDINTILSPSGLGVHSGLIDDPRVFELREEKVKAESGVDLAVRGLRAVTLPGQKAEVYAVHQAGAVLRRDDFEQWVQIPSRVVLPDYAGACVRSLDECGFPNSRTPSDALVLDQMRKRALTLGGCAPVFVIDLDRGCAHAEMLDETPADSWPKQALYSAVSRLPQGPTFVMAATGEIYEVDF